MKEFFKNRTKKRLLAANNPQEYGYWEVTGEPFGGNLSGLSQHVPKLGYFQGFYSDVVKHALDLPDFFYSFKIKGGEYGNKGGNITKIKIQKIY